MKNRMRGIVKTKPVQAKFSEFHILVGEYRSILHLSFKLCTVQLNLIPYISTYIIDEKLLLM